MTPELLAQIAELLSLTTEEVTALTLEEIEERLIAAFNERTADDAETPPTVEELVPLRDARRDVRAAIEAAEVAEAAAAAEIAALAAEMQPVDETTPPEGEEGEEPEGGGEDEEPAAPEGEALPAEAAATESAAEEQVPELVAAAATVPMRRRRPQVHAPVPRGDEDESAVRITAAADIPNFSAGARIGSLEQLGQAFVDKVDALGTLAADGGLRGVGKVPIARMHLEYPTDRQLIPGDDVGNAKKIAAAASPMAIMAAGGLCAPVAVRYEFENVSVDDRPVRDSLPRFNAERGGINVPTSPILTAPDAGVGVITETDDTNDVTKPCVVITCPSYSEVDISAVYQCLTIGNFARRTFPELFAQWWALAGALHARKAEGALLTGIGDATATQEVTDGQNLGAYRDVLESLIRARAEQISTYRMSRMARFRWMAPFWLRDLLAADIMREPSTAPGPRLQAAYDRIDSDLNAAGINATWYLDEETSEGMIYAAQGTAALQGWKLAPVSYFFTEGAFLFLDGGTLDLGTEIRDSTLNLHNNVNAFTETFENVAYVGQVPPLKITHSLCVSGSASLSIAVTCAENS